MLSNVTQADRAWLVKAQRYVTKAKRPCSLLDVVDALGRPADRIDDDLVELLDAIVGLRRFKKLPLRWEVAQLVRMSAPARVTPAASAASNVPAPVPIRGTRPTVPPQHAPRPDWPSAPFGGAKQLTHGSVTLTWSLLVRAVTDTVGDQYVDDIDLRVTRTSRAAASIPVRMCRAVDGRPYFVACLVPSGRQDANVLGAAGWHLWRPQDVLRFDDPRRLLPVPAPVTSGEAGCVATWRAPTPLELARALAVALHGLTATPSCTLHVTIRRTPAARRDGELHDIERQRRAASRSSTKPVRGFCRACGQPLRDLGSLKRGYGPECYARLRGKHDPSLNLNADIPLQYWAGAQPLPTVRRNITDWLQSLPQPAARSR